MKAHGGVEGGSHHCLLLLLLQHYSLLSLALASLTRNTHSVLSRALILHSFTSLFLKPNPTSTIHLNLGSPPFQ